MDDHILEKFRQLLEKQKNEYLSTDEISRDSTKPVELDQAAVGRLSRIDAMQSQAMAQETARRRTIQLAKIDAALERIQLGEYGYCAVCDEEIPQRRLEVDPAVPFCVHCASKM